MSDQSLSVVQSAKDPDVASAAVTLAGKKMCVNQVTGTWSYTIPSTSIVFFILFLPKKNWNKKIQRVIHRVENIGN